MIFWTLKDSILLFLTFLGLLFLFNNIISENGEKVYLQKRSLSGSDFCSEEEAERINWDNLYIIRRNETEEKALLWCKVPKAASTTLSQIFLKWKSAPENLTSNNVQMHYGIDDFQTRLKFLKPEERSNLVEGQDGSQLIKKFLVVRHPFVRLLSAYRDKLEDYQRDLNETGGKWWEKHGQFMVKRGRISNDSNLERRLPRFPEFLEYVVQQDIQQMDKHWQPITQLCSPCAVKYDVVVKVENLEDDIQPLLNFMMENETENGNLSLLEKLQSTGSSNTALIKVYYKSIESTTLLKLYDKFRGDFELFNYSIDKYL